MFFEMINQQVTIKRIVSNKIIHVNLNVKIYSTDKIMRKCSKQPTDCME